MYPFNQTAFNRPSLAEIFAQLEMKGISGIQIDTSRTTNLQATIEGNGDLESIATRITFSSLSAKGYGNIVIPLGKSRTFNTDWRGIGTFEVNNESFTIYIMEYYGDLKPDDRVIIDTERFTVTKNNENALEEFDGNFMDLKVGVNEVSFSDNGSTRTILLRVEHKDRFL